MDELNFPSNTKSQHVQEEKREKKIPVVTGDVIEKKPTAWGKFKSVFFAEEDRSFGETLFESVVGGIRDTIADGLISTIQAIFGGGSPRGYYGGSSTRIPRNSYTSYSSYSKGTSRRKDPDDYDAGPRSPYDYETLIFATRGDAESVLDSMRQNIRDFKTVSVGDMFEFANRDCPFTYYDYGWINLNSAHVERVRGGYLIRLPKASILD